MPGPLSVNSKTSCLPTFFCPHHKLSAVGHRLRGIAGQVVNEPEHRLLVKERDAVVFSLYRKTDVAFGESLSELLANFAKKLVKVDFANEHFALTTSERRGPRGSSHSSSRTDEESAQHGPRAPRRHPSAPSSERSR